MESLGPLLDAVRHVSSEAVVDDAVASEFASHVAPGPPKPASSATMADYRNPDMLPTFDAEVPADKYPWPYAARGPATERRFGTSFVIGDKDMQDAYQAVRRQMIVTGPLNQEVLYKVEHGGRPVTIYPSRTSDRLENVKKKTATYRSSEPGQPPKIDVRLMMDQGAIGEGGQKLSSATLAMHELAHVVQILDGTFDALRKRSLGRYTDASERQVIDGSEAEALKAIGQQPRPSHQGIAYRVQSGDTVDVNETKAADPFFESLLVNDTADLATAMTKASEFGVDMANPPEPEPVTDIDDVASGAKALGFVDWTLETLAALGGVSR